MTGDSGEAPPGANGRNQGPSVQENVSFSVDSFAREEHDHRQLGLADNQVLEMYSNMLLQRRFEERAAQMYGKQKIAGFLHLYIGQEAVSTGAATALKVGHDSVITAYRDHGIGLALGMGPNECMAELFGRSHGCSKGKGGSMHYFSKELRLFGGHGIVGGHIPVSTGIAFAHKYKEDNGVCLCFFGDGAVGQGSFHEALNLASLYKLPVVFIIENNHYAMGTSVDRAFAETDFYKQAVGYNMPGAVADGMDVFDIYNAISKQVQMARDFQPSILEIRTYRYRGHSMSDPGNYRTKEELDSRKNDDPIIRLKAYILDRGLAMNDTLDMIDDQVKKTVLDAVEFADNDSFPDLEEIYHNVYTQEDYPFVS